MLDYVIFITNFLNDNYHSKTRFSDLYIEIKIKIKNNLVLEIREDACRLQSLHEERAFIRKKI